MQNLQRKAVAAENMFSAIVEYMNDAIPIERTDNIINETRKPTWL